VSEHVVGAPARTGRGGGCCHCCYPAHSPDYSRGAARFVCMLVCCFCTCGQVTRHRSHEQHGCARTGEESPHFHRGNPSAVLVPRFRSFAPRGVLCCNNGLYFALQNLITDLISLERFFKQYRNIKHATTTEKSLLEKRKCANALVQPAIAFTNNVLVLL
jgi:hypothetical protein